MMPAGRREGGTVRALNLLIAAALAVVGSSLIVAAAWHNAPLALGAGTALVGSAIAYVSTRALARAAADAEEKSRKQTALQRQLDLFANVVDQLSLAVVVTGDDGATFANRKARELGAWPAAPDGGIAPEAQPPWQLRDAGGRPVQRDGWPLRRALLRGEQVAAEAIQVVSPDGSASWFETSAGPVYGAGM